MAIFNSYVSLPEDSSHIPIIGSIDSLKYGIWELG
jgi:hypothetical protein